VPTPPRDVPDLLARLVAADPGRPRITVYDDTDGPTRGERVELSARVLANWVAKAGNLLQEELDAGPGTVVRLDLPPHWRTLYWALAVWSVGACVDLTDGADDGHTADVLVTDDRAAAAAADGDTVLVTLAALARSAPGGAPAGAVDEARDLATHGDVLDPWAAPAPGDPALRTDDEVVPHGGLLPAGAGPERWHTADTTTAAFLRLALAALTGDGSLVLTRGVPAPDVLDRRRVSEGGTASA
jgi:uncharacterized protein (TIGR03089 family)